MADVDVGGRAPLAVGDPVVAVVVVVVVVAGVLRMGGTDRVVDDGGRVCCWGKRAGVGWRD